MKPGKPLERRSELARTVHLTRKSPLARAALRTNGAHKPRQARRNTKRPNGYTDIPQAARDAVAARSGGLCEATLPRICLGRAGNVHHRRRRNVGPDPHSLTNLLHLCGSGTTGCHGWITEHPTASKQPETGWIVPSTSDPACTPVRVRGRLVWLTDDGKVVGEVAE